MNIRNQYMGSLATPEVNKMPSLTVPDQTMSISEIMRRFAAGLPVGGARVPLYEEDDESEENTMPHFLDKMEAIEYARENSKRIESLRNDLAAQSKAAEEKSKSLKTPAEPEKTPAEKEPEK